MIGVPIIDCPLLALDHQLQTFCLMDKLASCVIASLSGLVRLRALHLCIGPYGEADRHLSAFHILRVASVDEDGV